MTYTEQDVERVAAAMFDLMIAPRTADQGNIYHRLARVALEAMGRELYQSRYGGRDPGEDYDFASGHFEVTDDVFEVTDDVFDGVGVEPEPLEDVLRAQHVYNIQIEPAGPNYYAEVVSAAHDRRTGTGATIDDAIRNAIKAAKEGAA